MATNKHAVIRYQTLDRCFRNYGRRYFIEDLVEECSKSLYNYNGSHEGVQRRQVLEDIKFMESDQGWSIDLDRLKDGRRVYYRYADASYSINNHLLNETEEMQLKEALLILSRFKGMPQFEWIEEIIARLESSFSTKYGTSEVIEFEQNPYLKGLEFFGTIFNAIVYKKVITIQYQSFKQNKPSQINFHPYYLKQYNSRWFVFGRNESAKQITNLAIDRIHKISDSKQAYLENDLVDFNEYFDDVVGVTVPIKSIPEKIVLEVENELAPYIESKPLHGSQKIKERGKKTITIELLAYINYEITALIFSLGEKVNVQEPESLKNAIRQKIEILSKKYL